MMMNRLKFAEDVAHFHLNAEQLSHHRAGTVQAGILLVSLLTSRTAWSQVAVVDVFTGKHGAALAEFALAAIQEGCSTYASREKEDVLCAPQPFSYWCAAYGRVDTLRAVVALDLAIDFDTFDMRSTTKAGKMLDRLSSLHARGPNGQSLTYSFLSMVRDKRRDWDQATVRACLDLFAELDPHHGAISKHTGTEFGALITEALMRVRIGQSRTEPRAEAAEPSRRRSLAL